MYYFTSEQLSEPTGSFKQLDIATTAASIAPSSPCSIPSSRYKLQPYSFSSENLVQCKQPHYKHRYIWAMRELHLLFPVEHISIFPGQTAPKATWNIKINGSPHVEVQYIACSKRARDPSIQIIYGRGSTKKRRKNSYNISYNTRLVCMNTLPKVGSATKTIVLSSTCQKSLIAKPEKHGNIAKPGLIWSSHTFRLVS